MQSETFYNATIQLISKSEKTVSMPLPPPTKSDCIERVLLVAVVIWLQVVGVVTETIVHHILHALPIVVLAVVPRSQWVRHTSVLVGFTWILMLALITPMIRYPLLNGIVFDDRQLAYTWLAPVMVLMSAAWAATNLCLLTGNNRRWVVYAMGLIVIAVVFAAGQPWISSMYEIPLQNILEGNTIWLVVLGVELPTTLWIPWWSLRWYTREMWEPLTWRSAFWQALYWVFFLACMIIGLSQPLN